MLAFTFGRTVALPVTWAAVVAALIPFVTALLVRRRERADTAVRVVVSLVLTVLLAVWAALTDDIPQDTFLGCVAIFLSVMLPVLVVYLTVGKALRINDRLAPAVGI